MKNLKYNLYTLTSAVKGQMQLRFGMICIACICMIATSAQVNRQLAQADQYFEAGEYVTAAGLYGQFLHPDTKSKKQSGFPLNARRNGMGNYETETDVMFRQAESFRLANHAAKAAELYRQCFEKDKAKYITALFWYAVCMRSTGNYAEAEKSLHAFMKDPASSGSLQHEAQLEKQRIEFIRQQRMRPDTVLYDISKIKMASGNDQGLFGAVLINGNQVMVTSTRKDSVAPGENPYHNHLFLSEWNSGSLQDLQPFDIGMVDASTSQGAASISADGRFIYFTQWTKENGQLRSGIWYAEKTAQGWSTPTLLSNINQNGFNSRQPACTADGKYLYFASDRKGGLGNYDIWIAPLMTDGNTGEPVNAGPVINSSNNEVAPFYHLASGTLVFASDRMPGMGGYDLFMSMGSGSEWKRAENMGYPVNSSRDDIYFFSAGKENLLDRALISSDRGSECCLETYNVTKKPKNKILTGLVRDCGNNEGISQASVVIKDEQGNSMQAMTDSSGTYRYEWSSGNMRQLVVSREKYMDKFSSFQVDVTNEINPFTDTLYHKTVCLDKKLVLKVENVVTVYFNYNESRLKPDVKTKLDSIYQVLVNENNITIQISGYSDDIGSVEYNKKLSEKRAKACTDYLINRGIDPSRISYASFGACCPVEMKLINVRDKRESKSLDRRALININRE